MNIQKVKEALEAAKAELPELSSAPNGKEPKAIRAARLVAEAIAELEKQVDDDTYKCCDAILECVNGAYLECDYEKALTVLHQYVESYHAKKCDGIADRIMKSWRENGDEITLRKILAVIEE